MKYKLMFLLFIPFIIVGCYGCDEDPLENCAYNKLRITQYLCCGEVSMTLNGNFTSEAQETLSWCLPNGEYVPLHENCYKYDQYDVRHDLGPVLSGIITEPFVFDGITDNEQNYTITCGDTNMIKKIIN